MKYNLFLDDIRTVDMVYPATDHDFVIVRSYADCIAYIKANGLPDFMSFDNDLGEDENQIVLPDGYAVAKWLVYKSGLDLTNFKYKVHSANPVAKNQIEGLLNNYKKFLETSKPISATELSVTEYAGQLGLTRQAVLIQIKQNRLPENVSAKKIGATWVLIVIEKIIK